MEDLGEYGSPERFVPDLKGMSLTAAMGMAVAMSGKSDDVIAAEMGWSESVKNRVFSNKDYWPSLPTLPTFCRVVGNTILVRWVAANAEYAFDRYEPMDAGALVDDLRRVMHDVARVMEEGQKTLEDWVVEPEEARRVLRRLNELLSACCGMAARLQARMDTPKGRKV